MTLLFLYLIFWLLQIMEREGIRGRWTKAQALVLSLGQCRLAVTTSYLAAIHTNIDFVMASLRFLGALPHPHSSPPGLKSGDRTRSLGVNETRAQSTWHCISHTAGPWELERPLQKRNSAPRGDPEQRQAVPILLGDDLLFFPSETCQWGLLSAAHQAPLYLLLTENRRDQG